MREQKKQPGHAQPANLAQEEVANGHEQFLGCARVRPRRAWAAMWCRRMTSTVKPKE
jgi:hypothetical protein